MAAGVKGNSIAGVPAQDRRQRGNNCSGVLIPMFEVPHPVLNEGNKQASGPCPHNVQHRVTVSQNIHRVLFAEPHQPSRCRRKNGALLQTRQPSVSSPGTFQPAKCHVISIRSTDSRGGSAGSIRSLRPCAHGVAVSGKHMAPVPGSEPARPGNASHLTLIAGCLQRSKRLPFKSSGF